MIVRSGNKLFFMVPAMDQLSLQGSTALVTGGTSPLGNAVALLLARNGADIIVHYHRSAQKAQALCREIRKLCRRSCAIRADFRKESETEALVGKAKKSMGRPNILINNAATYTPGTFQNMTVSAFFNDLRINTCAPLVLCRQFAKRLDRGVIVNLLDSRIVGGDPGHAGYMVSKQALEAASRFLAFDFAPKVRVNSVAPGLICIRPQDRQRFLRSARSLPLERFGTSLDVARAVLFLVESEYITGQCIYVDGGRQVRELLCPGD
jgi:pteridine reductase